MCFRLKWWERWSMSKIIFEVDKEIKKKFKEYCIKQDTTMTEVLRGFVKWVANPERKVDELGSWKWNN